jgi:hypothetical protein
MGKWIEKLKRFFTMTPEQLNHAETELNAISGVTKYCMKENKCPGWKFIDLFYPFWAAIGHCPYFRNNQCIMTKEQKQTAKKNLKLLQNDKRTPEDRAKIAFESGKMLGELMKMS